MKTLHKALKIFIIATKELYLSKFYKTPAKTSTRSFRTLPVPDSFNLYFILFHIVNF